MTDRGVLLYHPDNALIALEAAETLGFLDYAFASRYVPLDEIWIERDPSFIESYVRIMNHQKTIVDEATIAR